MSNNVSQGYRLLNPLALDERYLQADFFGQDLGAGEANQIRANSPTLFVGMPFFDEKTGDMYYISGISGDTLTWLTTPMAPSSFYNRTTLLKFAENDNRAYFNGKLLLIGEDLTDFFVSGTYIPDNNNQIELGNFHDEAWATIKSGNYYLIGEGVHFSNVPFTKFSNYDYLVVAEVFNSDVYHHVRITVSSIVDNVNNNLVYTKSGLLGEWNYLATAVNVNQIVTDAINGIEYVPHSHKHSVANIAELQRWGVNVALGIGIPDNEKQNGYIVKVTHYDEANINSSTAESKIIMFEESNVNAYWNDISKWRWLDDEVGTDVVLTPVSGVLTIPLKTQKWMSAALTVSTTITFTDAATNVGRTLLIDITGAANLDDTGLNIIGGEVEEDKIQMTIVVRSSTEVRCWIENIPA